MFQLKRRRGFSLIELLIVIAIILIILTFAVPKYQKIQKFARETAAIQAIKTLHTTQVQYYSQFGRYAASLAELGPPASGTEGPNAAGLISSDLASGEKQGYKFTLSATPGGYIINGNPVVFGSSGDRTFYSDQTMAIHQNFGADPATVQSPELK